MAWLRRHFEGSMAELDATATRLHATLAAMENDPACDNDAYDVVNDLLTVNHTARVTLQDRWDTRHYTAADWASQRLIAQNID